MSRSMIRVWRSVLPPLSAHGSHAALCRSPSWMADCTSINASSSTTNVLRTAQVKSLAVYPLGPTTRIIPTFFSLVTAGSRGLPVPTTGPATSAAASLSLPQFHMRSELDAYQSAGAAVAGRCIVDAPTTRPLSSIQVAAQPQDGYSASHDQRSDRIDTSAQASRPPARKPVENTKGCQTAPTGGIRSTQNSNSAPSGQPTAPPADGGTAAAAAASSAPPANSFDDSDPDLKQNRLTELADLEEALAQMKTQLAEAEEKQATLQDRLLRALAENENLRQRYQKELESSRAYAISKFAESILNVADSLDMALQQLKGKNLAASSSNTPGAAMGAHEKSVLEGVEMTRGVLSNVLAQHNISSFNPVGEAFNPSQHDALFEVPGTGKTKGTVVQVVKLGYRIKERILRPAQVGTAK